MTQKILTRAIVAIALAAPLGACMQTASSNEPGAKYVSEMQACPPGSHWESLPNQSNTQQGYRCAQDR
jgi:hypothetical protein